VVEARLPPCVSPLPSMTLPAPRPLRPPPYPPRKPGFWYSARHAWNGLVHTVEHQPNMRIHLSAALMVGLVGSGIPLGLAERVTLIFCVLLVFFAEILNSALESLVDLATQEFDEKARVTKDAAAAAVLVLAIGSAVIFAALLVHNWNTVLSEGPRIRRQVFLGLPLVLLVQVLLRSDPRPLYQDVLVFLLCLGLLGVLSVRSTSSVFSAMTFGLVVLAGAAAAERQRTWRGQKKRPGGTDNAAGPSAIRTPRP
jgi:diacylglycerol kinase (ATP)